MKDNQFRTWPEDTAGERIPFVAGDTGAHCVVVVHLALGVEAAGTLARIRTLLVDAGEVICAVGGHQALGPAVGRRAEVALDARAHGLVVELPAL